jgi:hypothetical protein
MPKDYSVWQQDASPNRGGLWEKMLSVYLFNRDEFFAKIPPPQ